MVEATGIVIDSSTLDEGSGSRLVYQCCLRVFMNRPLRTRMMGGVGGEGETPSSTRLCGDRLTADLNSTEPAHCLSSPAPRIMI
jgi:hypothetical protein